MCGIFGVVLNNTNENIYNLIINGLVQLQNRGYDSAGISAIKNGSIEIHKFASDNNESALQKLKNLNLKKNNEVQIGIGHNRWATHGISNDVNAHPHLSNNNNFCLVHNGIINNYNELKQKLIQNGYLFISQTDSEVIVNQLDFNYNILKNTNKAIQKTINELKGTYSLLIQSKFEPNKLFCVNNGSPLLIGQKKDKVIITSEQTGFCNNMVKSYLSLRPNDICSITKVNKTIQVKTTYVYKQKNISIQKSEQSSLPYKHWTLKEINQQPEVVLNSTNTGGRIKHKSEVKLNGLERHIESLKFVNNIIILGCGTSYFAGLYGMYFFKQMCNFNTVQVFDGAEFNELDIPNIGKTVVIFVSQSGETKDLHRCVEITKRKKITTIGIINVVDSLIAREVDCGIYCNAGKEVGVASTKAFTSQVVCLSMMSVWFSKLNNCKSFKKRVQYINDLNNLSNDLKRTIDGCQNKVELLAKSFNANNLFLLGKGSDECIAKEGSLKIKEISYIHSEGYSSSSLKHGPFALLDENFPVIILNLDQTYRSNTLNCYQEVMSRKSPIIIISNDITLKSEVSCEVIVVPENKTFSSLLGIIPIQLFAYYLSVKKGINPDKPKNLAKVVTVE
jgi:glucosamine--fructose-6-phosphate aminotransferase (isomerizing)